MPDRCAPKYRRGRPLVPWSVVTGFERIFPQVVRHSDGYTVQFGGRFHIEYVEAERAAKIESEKGRRNVTLYPETLKWTRPRERTMTEEERTVVLERIRSGLHAMDQLVEIIPASP